MPIRDPSRTATLRRQFASQVRMRFTLLRFEIGKLQVEDSEEFARELNKAINTTLLSGYENTGRYQHWTDKYVQMAYVQGVARVQTDLGHQPLSPITTLFTASLNVRPNARRRLLALQTSAFEDLRAIASAVQAAVIRRHSRVLVGGKKADTFALKQVAQSVGINRALIMARTAVVRAQAHGQIDGFAEVGTLRLNLTNEQGCLICQSAIANNPYTLDQARDIVPIHPNCLCAWTAAES